jgi:hypothetical protein
MPEKQKITLDAEKSERVMAAMLKMKKIDIAATEAGLYGRAGVPVRFTEAGKAVRYRKTIAHRKRSDENARFSMS